MATFELPKKLDDIVDVKPLPDGWYTMRIIEEPILKPNREGDKMNIILSLQVQHDNPEYHGRKFTKYLPFPVDGDSTNIIESTGQSTEDSKLERIRDHAMAFDPDMDNVQEVQFEVGYEADFEVTTSNNRNEIVFFSTPVKAGEGAGKAGTDLLY